MPDLPQSLLDTILNRDPAQGMCDDLSALIAAQFRRGDQSNEPKMLQATVEETITNYEPRVLSLELTNQALGVTTVLEYSIALRGLKGLRKLVVRSSPTAGIKVAIK